MRKNITIFIPAGINRLVFVPHRGNIMELFIINYPKEQIYDQGAVVVMIILLLDLQQTVQSVPIITKVMTLNPNHGKVYLIQRYVIKVVDDL